MLSSTNRVPVPTHGADKEMYTHRPGHPGSLAHVRREVGSWKVSCVRHGGPSEETELAWWRHGAEPVLLAEGRGEARRSRNRGGSGGGARAPGCAGPGWWWWDSGFLLTVELVGAGWRRLDSARTRRRREGSRGVQTRWRKCGHALQAVGSTATTRSSSPVRVSPGAEERKPV